MILHRWLICREFLRLIVFGDGEVRDAPLAQRCAACSVGDKQRMRRAVDPLVEQSHILHELDGIDGLHEVHTLKIVKRGPGNGNDR